MNAQIFIDWREANRLHDQLDCMTTVLDDENMSPDAQLDVLEAQVHGLRAMLPERFTPTLLSPRPGVRLCAICHKHLEGGHERDGSNWCLADEETVEAHARLGE